MLVHGKYIGRFVFVVHFVTVAWFGNKSCHLSTFLSKCPGSVLGGISDQGLVFLPRCLSWLQELRLCSCSSWLDFPTDLILRAFFCLFLFFPLLATFVAGALAAVLKGLSGLGTCKLCHHQSVFSVMNSSMYQSISYFRSLRLGPWSTASRIGSLCCFVLWFFVAKLWIRPGISYLNNCSGGNGIICKGMENE